MPTYPTTSAAQGDGAPLELTDSTPLADILRLLPQNELDALSAIGDSRDDARWKIGDIARVWIDERHLPAMQICQIIGQRVDYGHERVRKLLYTSRYYHERPALRTAYENVRYSIFEHAKGCADPEAVLRAALEGQLSPAQVKFTSPALMDDLRDLYNRIPQRHEKEARSIMETARAKLMELL